ncbi:MAG: hypothetical protein APF80_17425 [Alphaproteobacteria bacterium BRH_c36]|nr:MAG: hypothetical protein APF80_17425 [Alphaproteobacteria bacterium BRH_c36]
MNGEWIAYYLEDDVGTGIYTVAERLYVEQNGPNLTGVYEPHVTTHPEGYQGPGSFIMKGHVVQNVIFGEYYIEGHALPRGFGVFQLMLLRNGDWAEGFCNFFADDNKIMGSPNIWIRKDSHQLELMRKHAEEYLKLNPTLLKAPFTV